MMPIGLKGFQKSNEFGFKKGYIPHNKGIKTFKKCTVEGCDHQLTGRGLCDMHWFRWKKHGDVNVVLTNKGKSPTLETRRKISHNLRGEKNFNWKGGTSGLHKMIRNTFEYKAWRTSIFIRDNRQCVLCGHKGDDLQIDHYPKSFAQILYENNIKSIDEAVKCEALWDKENNRILCYECHKKTDTFGGKGHINAHSS